MVRLDQLTIIMINKCQGAISPTKKYGPKKGCSPTPFNLVDIPGLSSQLKIILVRKCQGAIFPNQKFGPKRRYSSTPFNLVSKDGSSRLTQNYFGR